MITSFKSLGQSGGGSGYTLPVATSEVLGGVKIGSGITVDSAGTISVEGGGGSGIEVVSQLPASGTDGQVVVLEENTPGYIIQYSPNMDEGTTAVTVTAIGCEDNTKITKFEWYASYLNVYVNSDNSLTLTDGNDEEVAEVAVGETYTHTFTNPYENNTITFNVYATGFTFTASAGSLPKYDVHDEVYQPAQQKDTAYIWDSVSKTCDIFQKFREDGNTHKNFTIVTYFGELPQNEIIFEQKFNWGTTRYWVFDGEMIRAYNNIDLTDEEYWFVKPTLNSVKAGATNATFTDGLIVVNDYELNWELKVYGNWADAGNGHWKPLDYEAIKTNALQLVDKTMSTRLYMPGVGDIFVEGGNGEIIHMCLPEDFGTDGQILMSQGNESPGKWVNKEEITNGVKFWKGTQAEYDAMSGTGYDNSTLYIITDTPNAI